MREQLSQLGKRLPKVGLLLGAVLAYAGYLSFAVVRLLGSGLSLRVRGVIIAGWTAILIVCALVVVLVATRRGDRLIKFLEHWSHKVQAWDARLRTSLYLALVLLAGLLVYTDVSRGLMDTNSFRYSVLFALLVLACQFWPFQTPRHWSGRFLITILAGAYALLVGNNLQTVVDYPFSLSWSEGNRFYDYSMIFGKFLYNYNGNLSLPYYAPGRYGLWGIWFAIPGLSIAFHRFWNAILWIVPPLLLGWLLARSLSERSGLRLGIALWLGLYLSQGPVYAPILLVAAVVAGFDRSRPWMRYLSIAVASLYGGLSRWTWFAAAGAWAALLELTAHETQPKRRLARRLAAAVGVGILGSLPGVLANYSQLFAPKDIAFPLSQPLLWYRLWPNVTYAPGIVPASLLAAGPLMAALIWLVVSRRWRLDWLQIAAITGLTLATLGVGLVASVKIGGGSNLHNLDMFLISLGFLLMIYMDQAVAKTRASEADAPLITDADSQKTESAGREPRTAWPAGVMAIAVTTSLLMAWPYFANIRRLELPPPGDVQRSLDNLKTQIDKYREQGDVLFMDQRQLLAFGTVDGIPLIPEYEKKYLMDQAMASNASFYQGFYEDLTNKRFALIVSEPLFRSYDDEFAPFGEENNAWVKWVSEPVLCFYKPEKTYRAVRVELLVPREGSKDCELPQR